MLVLHVEEIGPRADVELHRLFKDDDALRDTVEQRLKIGGVRLDLLDGAFLGLDLRRNRIERAVQLVEFGLQHEALTLLDLAVERRAEATVVAVEDLRRRGKHQIARVYDNRVEHIQRRPAPFQFGDLAVQ